MNFKKSVITSITENLIPSCKKKVEKAVPDAVSQEVEGIYSETSKVSPDKIIGSYYINPDDVAPCARRLISPPQFNMTTGLSRVNNVIKNTRKMLDDIKDIEVQNSFKNLYERIINESSNLENLSENITTLAQKTEMIENPEIKKEVISSIKELNKYPRKKFRKEFSKALEFSEDLCDAVNVMNGKYMKVNSQPRELYKWLDESNSWFADVIDGTIKSKESYRNGYASQKGKMDYKEYLEHYDEMSTKMLPETYQNNLKYESFRHFVKKCIRFKPELVSFVYDNEYLKTIDPEIGKICKDIKKDTGTMVIFSNANMTKQDAEYVQEELRLWKEAGKGRELLPDIIDVNYLDKYLNKDSADGCASYFHRTVKVKELLEDDAKSDAGSSSTLRHEIHHILDGAYEYQPLDDFTKTYRKINWHIKKLFNHQKWDRELQKGNIQDDSLREYALTERAELKSVSIEADTNKFSKEYKDTLVNDFGMQRWALEIPENKVQKNQRYMNFMNEIKLNS